MIRVLVAEDSATSRSLLLAIFAEDPEIDVVGVAVDGVEAVELNRTLQPDAVTMDVHMPLLDGYEATRRIMAEHPTPVIMVSNLDLANVEAAMSALRVGALAAVAKPASPADPDFEARKDELLEAVKTMAAVRVVRQRHTRVMQPTPSRRDFDVVAIAASTGGPAVLATLLSKLPADFAAPLLVVQHMAAAFLRGFQEWLDGVCAQKVVLAESGARLEPGTVYVGPADHHLGVRGGRISLTEGAPIEGFRPSATALFNSVAEEYGPRAVGLILSGMGRDGADGLATLRRAGGTVVAQSEATCAIFGMPGAAIAEGSVDHVMAPEEMVLWLEEGAVRS